MVGFIWEMCSYYLMCAMHVNCVVNVVQRFMFCVFIFSAKSVLGWEIGVEAVSVHRPEQASQQHGKCGMVMTCSLI